MRVFKTRPSTCRIIVIFQTTTSHRTFPTRIATRATYPSTLRVSATPEYGGQARNPYTPPRAAASPIPIMPRFPVMMPPQPRSSHPNSSQQQKLQKEKERKEFAGQAPKRYRRINCPFQVFLPSVEKVELETTNEQ